MKHLNKGAFSALLSAIFFGICVPCSKILNTHVSSAIMGGLLYLGAGLGLSITMLFKKSKIKLTLSKKDFIYTIAMILLDISAILFLMYGVSKTSGANASLLGNFELAATTLIAFFLFGEYVSKRLFFAIILITIASIILTFEGNNCFSFNLGSMFVLISCICWGFENNCTKMLSKNDTRQITAIKGIFSGLGGLIIAFCINETLPELKWVILTLILGFLSYGISVSLYIYSQRFLGASKTGAYFSMAPFFGVIFSVVLLKERPLLQFYIALLIMIIASILVIKDTKNS